MDGQKESDEMGDKGTHTQRFTKGHESYKQYKKVDEDLFYSCLDLFLLGRMSIHSASKVIGLSQTSLTERWNAVLRGEEIPRKWFK